MNFFDILLAKKEAGGGDAVLKQKMVTQNGTYNASSDSADGYSKVTVNVPASAVDSGTKSITANGNNQDVVGYAAVNVNVPNTYAAGDEGKVVSGGALVAQTAHAEVTENGTIDTTLNNSVTVNVSGASISSGVVIKELLATGYIKDIDFYGEASAYVLGNTQNADYSFSRVENITLKSSITTIGQGAFCNFGRKGNGIASLTFPDVTSITGSYQFNGAYIKTLSFPSLESIGSGSSVFQSAMLENIYLPKLTTLSQANTSYGILRGATKLEYAEIGSVGYAAPSNIGYQFRECTQSTLTICIYCLGDQIDTILNTLRTSTGAPVNSTIIFKASASTTYNNVSYDAGDTILTSTPT